MPLELNYTERLRQIEAGIATMQSKQWLVAAILCGAVFMLLFMVRRVTPPWQYFVPASMAIASVRTYGQRSLARLRLSRLRNFYARGVRRVADDWVGEGETGEEFAERGHVYAQDLNLFGDGSMFQRLCITRTRIGARKLASYLQTTPASTEECLARQAAVQELTHATELREQVVLLGKEFNQASWETFSKWLDREPEQFHPWTRVLAVAAVFVFGQVALGWILRRRVTRVIEDSRAISVEIGVLREGLELLARQRFESPKLRVLARVAAEPRDALRQLERYLKILDERTKEWFYLPMSVVMAGSHCAVGIENWRRRHGADLARWIDTWAEFEALNALGCYAFECPDDVFPSFETGAVFDAESLGHPLLAAGSCVRNDIRFDGDGSRLMVISGSNMSGKSTLLRSIGLGAVLGAAGAPVRARKLRLSLFSTCASLSIQDAMQEGVSRFKAELDRLRETIRLATESPPVLFLIDEIFSGTNSRDRRVAAEAVVRTLVSAGAVGTVSTHDLALAEIAELSGLAGRNVHMGSREGGGPLDFDYLLKPGVSTQTNALAIARLAGVPI